MRVQAKVQDLETQVRELRDSAQRLEVERSRHEAELDVLRRLVARHGQPADAAAARAEQLEAYIRHLETRQRGSEAARASSVADRIGRRSC